jgi:hypothetical protein
MTTITRTETRPNLTTDWYRTPQDFIRYIQKFNNIRNRPKFAWTISNDMLSRTFVESFPSQQDYDAYMLDSTVAEGYLARKTYNDSNNIIEDKTIT